MSASLQGVVKSYDPATGLGTIVCDTDLNEYELATDALVGSVFRMLRQGQRVTSVVADTICDGLRATIGAPNLALMEAGGVGVLLVDDEQVKAAMRLAWERLKQVIEPSCATVLAAVLAHPDRFAGRRVGLILTGGNVDLDALPW